MEFDIRYSGLSRLSNCFTSTSPPDRVALVCYVFNPHSIRPLVFVKIKRIVRCRVFAFSIRCIAYRDSVYIYIYIYTQDRIKISIFSDLYPMSSIQEIYIYIYIYLSNFTVSKFLSDCFSFLLTLCEIL